MVSPWTSCPHVFAWSLIDPDLHLHDLMWQASFFFNPAFSKDFLRQPEHCPLTWMSSTIAALCLSPMRQPSLPAPLSVKQMQGECMSVTDANLPHRLPAKCKLSRAVLFPPAVHPHPASDPNSNPRFPTQTLCAGAHTYHTIVEVNRGLSWQAAVKFRDECDAEMASRGQSSSRNVGFFKDRIPDWGKTGGNPPLQLCCLDLAGHCMHVAESCSFGAGWCSHFVMRLSGAGDYGALWKQIAVAWGWPAVLQLIMRVFVCESFALPRSDSA